LSSDAVANIKLVENKRANDILALENQMIKKEEEITN